MMKLSMYIIDAFTDEKFGGNPAGVLPLQSWLPKETMQKIAMENNQAETAFFVPEGDDFSIKWFSPSVEIDLCGHATLSAAHVLFTHLGYNKDKITFHSNSGPLHVWKTNGMLTLDFPADFFLEVPAPDKLLKALSFPPKEIYIGKTDYLAVYDYEEQVRRMDPDFALLNEVRARGVIVTAKGNDIDFVYRFFAPQAGINEDPATGSAQTTLMQYWSKHLNKTQLNSLQLSKRIGKFSSVIKGDRVEISGSAITYLSGEILLDD